MDNKNIHRNYEENEIRDFLARELELSESGNIKLLEEKIERFKELLKGAKRRKVLLSIIKGKNWIEWDISEYVPYNKETYFPFIGTKEEYNKLVKKLSDSEEGDEQ
jgi:hypothetical protein